MLGGRCASAGDSFQFQLLAPSRGEVPQGHRKARVDGHLHSKLIFDTQLVRGLALQEYGSVGTKLLPDGRHYQAIDRECWHVLLQNNSGSVLGCARYRPIRGGFTQLAASQSPLAYSDRYGPMLKSAVETQIVNAGTRNVHYGEAGAWALRREVRGTTAAINIALMTFVLAEYLGGGVGITTATRLYHSASILRRLGGRRLADLPAYYEPKYGSVIEILHFSSDNVDSRYAGRLERLRSQFLQTPVVCAEGEEEAMPLHHEKGAAPLHQTIQ
jgi:hypothetical protein